MKSFGWGALALLSFPCHLILILPLLAARFQDENVVNDLREKLTSWGAVLSALLMSGCCLGPLILIPLGLSGLAGTLAIFSIEYQLFLMIMTLLFLGVSFYLVLGMFIYLFGIS
jgi:hypothetical protein